MDALPGGRRGRAKVRARRGAQLYLQRDQPPGVPPLQLTGERTLPDVPGGELLVPPPPRRLQWIASRVGGRRVVDLACGEGYGSAVLARTAASVVGVDANPEAFEHARLKYSGPRLRFERNMLETVGGRRRLRRVPADDRARRRTPTRCSSGCARWSAPDGVAYVSTPNVLTLAPAGAERSGNPWHVREYRAEEYRALCERHFGSVELLGLFHARKLRAHQVAIERLGLGSHPRGAAASRSRSTTASRPAISVRDFALRGGARSTARWTSSPCCAREPRAGRSASSCTPTCPTSRATGRGRSARSGCGRRWRPPTCRCSTCSTPRRGRVTLSLTPVLVRPARGARRGRALPRLPARRALGDAPARRRRRRTTRRSRASSSARPRLYAAAAERFEARGGDLVRRASRRTPRGRRRRRTPCCRCWPPTAGRAAAARDGHRGAPPPLRRLARRAVAARVRATRRGSTPLLEEAGVHAACVDLTDVLGHGAPGPAAPAAHRRRAAARPDRPRDHGPRLAAAAATPRTAPTATRAATPSTATRRGRSTARPTTRRARRAQVRADAEHFVAQVARADRARRALRVRARHGAARALLARGRRLAGGGASRRRSRRRRARAGSTTRSPSRARAGAGRPAADELGHAARPQHLERRRRRRSSRGARAPPSCGCSAGRAAGPARALRELLALQASDWAFLVTRGTAGPYPRERADGHAAELERALADPGAGAGSSRNLAPWLDLPHP